MFSPSSPILGIAEAIQLAGGIQDRNSHRVTGLDPSRVFSSKAKIGGTQFDLTSLVFHRSESDGSYGAGDHLVKNCTLMNRRLYPAISEPSEMLVGNFIDGEP